MTQDHSPNPLPGAHGSSGAIAGESSSRSHSRVRQTLGKVTKSATKKISKPFKRFRGRGPATGESASKVLDTPSGLKSAHDELRDALEAAERMKLLGKRTTDVASAVNNAPAGLAAVDDFQTTYLQPLKNFNTVIEKLADVHPYAKMALGALSAAFNIILAQADRDQSVDRLLKKLHDVYLFIVQEDTLSKISTMHSARKLVFANHQKTQRSLLIYFLTTTRGIDKLH